MTVKENLIKLIIDMDETNIALLEEFVNEIIWRNIPEEKATEEELEIFAKYQKGDEEYQCVFSVDEV